MRKNCTAKVHFLSSAIIPSLWHLLSTYNFVSDALEMVLFVRTCYDWDCEGVWKTFYWVYLNIIPSSIACLSSGRSIDWGLLRSFNFRFHTGDVISSLCCLKLSCAHQNTAPSSTSNFLWALELIQAMGRWGCERAELLLALQPLHTSSASAARSTLATFCWKLCLPSCFWNRDCLSWPLPLLVA